MLLLVQACVARGQAASLIPKLDQIYHMCMCLRVISRISSVSSVGSAPLEASEADGRHLFAWERTSREGSWFG